MKLQDLMESMNLAPVQKKKHEKYPQGIWSSVFPREWTADLDYAEIEKQGKTFIDYYHADEEPPRNPHVRDDLDFNRSNANMVHILSDVLGFQGDSGDGFLIPINEFIARATQWLQQSVGRRSAEVPTNITKDDGPTMVDMGRREGYDNEAIIQAVKIAREGKQLCATHMSAA